jgi:polar amino acid transport system substrate-binding protein
MNRWSNAVVLRWLVFSISLLTLPQAAWAKEILELHMPDAPPLTFVSFQGGYGMVGDVALAAIARAGYLSHLRVTPWIRAQQRVSRGDNLLIIPLTRSREREDLYTWIAPIMVMERAFFSLDTPVADFAEARERYKRIAVGMGTAQMSILKNQGFSDEQIVSIKLGDNPARMLELGRVDAWFTGVPEGLYQWPGSQNELHMSPVMSRDDLYLACSKRCDKVMVEELRQSVEALRREGTVQTILDAYLQQR